MDRNAWLAPGARSYSQVALRKESVDRNVDPDADTLTDDMSLSARRAWIEILCLRLMFWPLTGRSPQGERG